MGGKLPPPPLQIGFKKQKTKQKNRENPNHLESKTWFAMPDSSMLKTENLRHAILLQDL